MDRVDASAHYVGSGGGDDRPSLLTVIIDTNPFAWAELQQKLPFEAALAHILLFVNAHLAFSHANRVAVIASHTKEAVFLYPTPPTQTPLKMGAPGDAQAKLDATKYRLFAEVESSVQGNMRKLLGRAKVTPPTDETMMAGALSLALAYINRVCNVNTAPSAPRPDNFGLAEPVVRMTARVLVISVSGGLGNQYVSIMNSIFAAQRNKVPIDICKIAGDTVFLQQASDSTNGIYMQLEHPGSLLQYLLACFVADPPTRRYLVPPSQVNVDFRAACFCHKRVVDIGFVCSVCLSIFCSPPPNAICTTCSTKLDISALGNYGGKPAVVLVKKKKGKKGKKSAGVDANTLNGSAPGTPSVWGGGS